jgi:hypothetical protein
MKPALVYAALTIILHSANVSAQQLQKPSQPFVSVNPEKLQQQRIAYNKLIQDRFDEIANKFGGVQHLAESGNLQLN